MAVNYNRLWHLLIDKGMKKKDLRKAAGISTNTLAKLSKNENVSTSIIAKICEALNCNVEDVMEFVPLQEKECKGEDCND
ncbi:MAG: helix-turn-helix transcriptional regulator [Bacillota bacterium]|nr:helix-turn-helix transcriptional regulator [Bacillota bacterium]